MRFVDATVLLAAIGMTPLPAPAALPDGVWGGPGATLTISATGGVLQQDCGAGRFGPVKLSKAGRFKARGTWEDHQPGPQPADVDSSPAKADFEGHLKGDTLALTVVRPGHARQAFTLLKGKRVKLIRCL